MDESAKLDNLRAENARLIALLEERGIAWKKPADPVRVQSPAKESEPFNLSTDEKVALFMQLFRGRTDVYPMRWESKKTGKSGYFYCVTKRSRDAVQGKIGRKSGVYME